MKFGEWEIEESKCKDGRTFRSCRLYKDTYTAMVSGWEQEPIYELQVMVLNQVKDYFSLRYYFTDQYTDTLNHNGRKKYARKFIGELSHLEKMLKGED